MSWDYRVLEKTYTAFDDEKTYGIVEAYYDDENDLKYVTGRTEYIEPSGDTLEELRWTLEEMLKALDKEMIKEEVK